MGLFTSLFAIAQPITKIIDKNLHQKTMTISSPGNTTTKSTHQHHKLIPATHTKSTTNIDTKQHRQHTKTQT